MKARVVAAVLVLVAVSGGAWWFTRPQPIVHGLLAGYNVLLVTIDTLRVDRVGAYGSTAGLTPTLDRLAAEGRRFDSARSHVPLTLPAHASLMTGRLPPSHGVRDNGTYRLGDSLPTIATVLKAAGYRTAAFVGAFVLDARFGLARGFDEYDDRYGQRSSTPGEVIERPAEQVAAPATAWMLQAAGPWFAWVHFYDPHEPYAPPEPFASRYSASPYDGEVAYADAALGRMLDSLHSAGRLDRTLVVVTSDHGEALGDHGERTHGLFAYESTLRVPLILWSRDHIQPGLHSEAVGLVDVGAMMLDLVGVAGLAGTGGRSSATYFEALNASLTRNWAPLTGVIDGGLKLIDLPIPELYDITADPGETQNLYARRPEDARRLERTLDAVGGGAPPTPGAAVDAETAARLRSLGYVVAQPQNVKRRYTPDDDPKRLVMLDTAMDEAMAVAGRGDYATAIRTLEEIIKKRPDLTVAYDRLAFVLRAAGQVDRAVTVLEEAASKGLADASLLVSLGTTLQEAGRFDRSAAVLETAIRMNPQDLEAKNRLGTTYARMGRNADAEHAFRAVLESDPKSAEALTNLGVLFLTTGRRDQAIATLKEAIAADPGIIGARNTLAVAYAKAGDLARAVDEWQQILAIRPDDPDVLYNAGTTLLQLDRRAEAEPLLERFIATAPPRYAEDVARLKQTLRSSR